MSGIKSGFAILDVKAGRVELALRIAHGAQVRVQVDLLIKHQHSHDDGTSIEFSGEVLSVTEGENSHAELVKALEADIFDLEVYINNPSAWDSFDDDMSERLRKVVNRARAALATLTAREVVE